MYYHKEIFGIFMIYPQLHIRTTETISDCNVVKENKSKSRLRFNRSKHDLENNCFILKGAFVIACDMNINKMHLPVFKQFYLVSVIF